MTYKTLLDDIADIVSEFDLDGTTAIKLHTLMKKFKEERSVTYGSLIRIPGFKKLWDALDEAVHSSLRIER